MWYIDSQSKHYMNKLETLFGNLENGHLKEAKTQAKKFSAAKLREWQIERGVGSELASLTAIYLKGGMEFQEYCDQEFKLR